MAYKNLTAYAPTDKAAAFIAIRDFLCKRGAYSATGVGWSLWDSFYAVDENNPQVNDWVVIYSPGESGDEDIYFYAKWISGGMQIWGYQSWDPATNTGANKFGTTTTWLIPETAGPTNPLYIYADLDVVTLIMPYTAGGVDFRGDIFGKALPTYDGYTGTAATAAGALSAGSDISIALDAVPAEWAIGDEIFIRTTHTNNTATVEIEKITIKTIVSNTITADLANAYTAGSRLQNHMGYFAQDSSNAWSTTKCLIAPDGSIGYATSWLYNASYTAANYDPEAFDGIVMLYQTGLVTALGAVGVLDNIRRTPVHNAFFTNLDTVVSKNGDTYRLFKITSSIYMAFREV